VALLSSPVLCIGHPVGTGWTQPCPISLPFTLFTWLSPVRSRNFRPHCCFCHSGASPPSAKTSPRQEECPSLFCPSKPAALARPSDLPGERISKACHHAVPEPASGHIPATPTGCGPQCPLHGSQQLLLHAQGNTSTRGSL